MEGALILTGILFLIIIAYRITSAYAQYPPCAAQNKRIGARVSVICAAMLLVIVIHEVTDLSYLYMKLLSSLP